MSRSIRPHTRSHRNLPTNTAPFLLRLRSPYQASPNTFTTSRSINESLLQNLHSCPPSPVFVRPLRILRMGLIPHACGLQASSRVSGIETGSHVVPIHEMLFESSITPDSLATATIAHPGGGRIVGNDVARMAKCLKGKMSPSTSSVMNAMLSKARPAMTCSDVGLHRKLALRIAPV